MHQTKPYEFIEELIKVTNKTLILRLRTRDVGHTELDINKSCQMHYEKYWMPYVVLNFEELIGFLNRFKKIEKVTFNKEYQVLGGSNQRYLPKDRYFKEAKSAETSLMIEFSDKANKTIQINKDQSIQGHAFVKNHKLHNFIFKVLHKLSRT